MGTSLVDVTRDPSALDSSGRWAVVVPYSGEPVFARFANWRAAPADSAVQSRWTGPATSSWRSSMSRDEYMAGVEAVRDHIAKGDVYQANVCRVMSAPLRSQEESDIAALHALLSAGHDSPYGGMIKVPSHDVHVATASPELFLRRNGNTVHSGPIKGTGRVESDLSDKDRAENVMIVDLVRNDLAHACDPGSVHVPSLLAVEHHPGLVHLVSTVAGELVNGNGWPELLAGAFPPGSVTGAPKYTALQIISDIEKAPREVYCGAVGWVDADTKQAELAVAIRTFWLKDNEIRFGTGAGITWGSDAAAEWDETELKAERLVALASGRWEN